MIENELIFKKVLLVTVKNHIWYVGEKRHLTQKNLSWLLVEVPLVILEEFKDMPLVSRRTCVISNNVAF